MKFLADVKVMPLKELLDPQGKAVNTVLHKLNLEGIKDVRIGKHITLLIESDSKQKAEEMTDEACKKILTNQVMENYEFEINEI